MNARAIRDRLEHGDRLRVAFLNDLGFQYGAGLAHLRQIQSFLLAGHEVCGVCWAQGEVENGVRVQPNGSRGRWLGMTSLPELRGGDGRDDRSIVKAIVAQVEPLHPELVIVGNLHAARWPLALFDALRRTGAVVVGFMHDCYFATGRCAYPGECRLHETGCDTTCPTAAEYPALPAAQIPGAWRHRRELFSGPEGIPLASNSRWTLDVARRSFAGMRFGDVVYYGLDERLFRPIDRALSRRLLGIPEDRFVVLGGAVNMSDRRKGGAVFRELAAALRGQAHFLVFGAEASGIDGVEATGLLRDYRKMPLLYSAADLFVATSLEEAFGQTLCEAAACGLPSVAFRVGGIPEIARPDCNACLVEPFDVRALVEEVRALIQDAPRRAALGRAGRELVEREFTLAAQAARWMKYLDDLCSLGARGAITGGRAHGYRDASARREEEGDVLRIVDDEQRRDRP